MAGVAGAVEAGKYRSRSVMQGLMGLSMLGRIQVMPRWENDPVWRHDSGNGREGRGGCG